MEQGTRAALLVLPPMAAQQFLQTTSNTAATINLATIGPQTQAVDSQAQRGGIGAAGKYITVSAITADVYVAFSSAEADIDNITATSTGTNQANTAFPIFAGTSKDFWIPANTSATWMGYVTASGSGHIHIYISSYR
jgi:hypothetical protein